jgi:hypothetical protein
MHMGDCRLSLDRLLDFLNYNTLCDCTLQISGTQTTAVSYPRIIKRCFPSKMFPRNGIQQCEFLSPRSHASPSSTKKKKKKTPTQPRVEAGNNTTTAVPASRKRPHKGNTVSDETVMYGYWSSVTGLDL